MEELKEKIEEYKEKKKRRTERKAKWENWIKTQVGPPLSRTFYYLTN